MSYFTAVRLYSIAEVCVFAALLVVAIGRLGEDLETVLGWTHGLMWIGMSIACLVATRLRVIPLRVAVAVVVLGGVGPFFGSIAFIRQERATTR